MSRTMKASEFKAKCLRLLDEVQHSRTEIVITKRGRPVARLVPAEEEIPKFSDESLDRRGLLET